MITNCNSVICLLVPCRPTTDIKDTVTCTHSSFNCFTSFSS